MLFICAHGHCYGGHMVHRAEGRRDIAAALWGFLEHAPDVLVYDFACGAEEYLNNRYDTYVANVSTVFANIALHPVLTFGPLASDNEQTSFFHDVFHGTTHRSCSAVYNSRRFPQYNWLNTSLCEQFNAFLKVSLKSLT